MKTTVKVSFGDIKFGKKTTIAIEIKGTLSDEQKLSLLEFANSDGFVTLASAQSDITDYGVTAYRGLKATITNDGVSVDPDQLDMDQIIKEDEPEKELNWLEQEEKIAAEEAAESEEEKEEEQQPEEVDLVAAIALMPFKFQGVELKKGAEIEIPSNDVPMFVNNGLVKVVEKADELDDSLI
jgi:hypothetical protein